MDDLEQTIKDKLLEGLIEHMHSRMGDDLSARFPKKGMEVSVEADDPKSLAGGLEAAEELAESPSEESDEDRLMSLLGEDDKDDEDELEV